MGSMSAPKQRQSAYQVELGKIGAEQFARYQETLAPYRKRYRQSLSRVGNGREMALDVNAAHNRAMAAGAGGVSPRRLGGGMRGGAGRAMVAGNAGFGVGDTGTARRTGARTAMMSTALGTGINGLRELDRAASLDQAGINARAHLDAMSNAGLGDALGTGLGYALYNRKTEPPGAAEQAPRPKRPYAPY